MTRADPRRHHHRPLLGRPLRPADRRPARGHGDVRQVGRRLPDQHRRSARRGSASRAGLITARRRRALGPLHPRAARPRGRRHARRQDRSEAADRAGRSSACATTRRFPLIFYRDDCADMALDEDDIDEAFIASAKARRASPARISRPPTADAMSRKAIARREGRRPARRLRRRLPPEPLGPRRPRRRRGALHPLRHGHGAPADDRAGLRPHRRHRGGAAHRRRRRRTRSRRCARIRALTRGDDRLQARPDGLRRLPRRDPGVASRTASRARASRSRSTTCSAPATPSWPASCAAGCATSRSRPPAPTPMPAAPSRCRASCARRNIRPGRSCSTSSRTAAATPRAAARSGARPYPLGDDAPAGSPDDADGACHRSSRAARGAWPTGLRRGRASGIARVQGARPSRARRPACAGRPTAASACCSTARYGREALFDAAEHGFWIGAAGRAAGLAPARLRGRRTSARILSNGRSTTRSSACASTIPTIAPELKERQEAALRRGSRRLPARPAASC